MRASICAVVAATALCLQACGGGGSKGGAFVPAAPAQPNPPSPSPPTSPPPPTTFNPTSFTVLFHVAGDDFKGFSAALGNGGYNDLRTQADRAVFLGDMISAVNAVWAPSGVQIAAASAITDLSTAKVQAAEPSLIVSGFTAVGDAGTTVRWGNLGAPATDPGFGLAMDVFLVQRPTPGGNGAEAVGFAIRSGTFEGRGTTHGATFALFSASGQPIPRSTLFETMAHEMAHFLSLPHTTETTFVADNIADTPFSTVAANDTNKNGQLDAGDALSACPDAGNLMFPFSFIGKPFPTITAGQGAAMRAYLTATKH